MNEIINIGGIDCYEEDGTAYLKLEPVARGLGFTQTEIKNGTEYVTIRWNRVFNYLSEFGFDHSWSKDDYIPENIFYRLAMKAKNEAAEKFQAKIADEVIPSIRKTGQYKVPGREKEDGNWVVDAIKELLSMNYSVVDQQSNDMGAIVASNNEIISRLLDMTPTSEHPAKSNEVKIKKSQSQPQSTPPLVRHTVSFELTGDAYRDALVNATKKKWTATEIAKDYGMSARDFNIMLRDFGIQHKEGKVWRPNDEYVGNGFDAYSEVWNENYEPSIMFWTQTGRLFLYDFLKEHGKSPKFGPVVDEAA